MDHNDLPVLKTKTGSGTWLGRRGEYTEIHHDSKNMGLRTLIHTWIDVTDEYPAGTVVTRLIEGDGRTDSFVEHSIDVRLP